MQGAHSASAVLAGDPKADDKVTSNAYNTLFVGRLAYETSEAKLRAEMETVGPVDALRLVQDSAGQSRGYAFVQFKSDEHLRAAYRKFNGYVIDGRRVLADVERGRTVPGWRPKRLGGGLGATRKDVKKGVKNNVPPGGTAVVRVRRGRAPPPRAGYGGDRGGGFRGGYGGDRGGYGGDRGGGYGGDRGRGGYGGDRGRGGYDDRDRGRGGYGGDRYGGGRPDSGRYGGGRRY